MNLQKKLAEWQQHKLITAKQAKAIGEFEAKAGKPVLSYLLWALSALFIGVGIISLIAANWQSIPAAVKLIADFTLLTLCGWAVFYTRDWQKQYLNEALLLLYALLILATIGLIAQVYQLQSHDYRAFFAWSVLCIPLLPLSRYRALSWVWLPVFIFSGLDLLDNFSWYHSWQGFISGDYPAGEYLFILFLIAFAYAATCRREVLMAFNLALRDWLVIGAAVLTVYLDFFLGYHSGIHAGIFPPAAVFLICLAAILTILNIRRALSLFDVWILASLTVFAWMFGFIGRYNVLNELLGFILTLSILALLLVYAYRFGNAKLMNLAAVLIAFRVFGGYLQVFGSLTATGFGLIFSGLIFLALMIIWKKVTSSALFAPREKSHDK